MWTLKIQLKSFVIFFFYEHQRELKINTRYTFLHTHHHSSSTPKIPYGWLNGKDMEVERKFIDSVVGYGGNVNIAQIANNNSRREKNEKKKEKMTIHRVELIK